MAAAFLSQQISHADSLLLLDDHRDTQLIARSMVEGMCQLFWAYHEADTRPLRWRLFSVIIDWRRMKAMENSGEPIAKARRQKIETQLKQHGGQFLRPITKSGAALTSEGRDPYVQDWTGGVKIRTIFEQASAELLYSKLYQPFAAWHHWSLAGIGPSIVRRRGIVALYTRDVRAAMGATALAFQCLLESARLLDSHLKLGFDDRIAGLRRRYISTWTPIT